MRKIIIIALVLFGVCVCFSVVWWGDVTPKSGIYLVKSLSMERYQGGIYCDVESYQEGAKTFWLEYDANTQKGLMYEGVHFNPKKWNFDFKKKEVKYYDFVSGKIESYSSDGFLLLYTGGMERKIEFIRVDKKSSEFAKVLKLRKDILEEDLNYVKAQGEKLKIFFEKTQYINKPVFPTQLKNWFAFDLSVNWGEGVRSAENYFTMKRVLSPSSAELKIFTMKQVLSPSSAELKTETNIEDPEDPSDENFLSESISFDTPKAKLTLSNPDRTMVISKSHSGFHANAIVTMPDGKKIYWSFSNSFSGKKGESDLKDIVQMFYSIKPISDKEKRKISLSESMDWPEYSFSSTQKENIYNNLKSVMSHDGFCNAVKDSEIELYAFNNQRDCNETKLKLELSLINPSSIDKDNKDITYSLGSNEKGRFVIYKNKIDEDSICQSFIDLPVKGKNGDLITHMRLKYQNKGLGAFSNAKCVGVWRALKQWSPELSQNNFVSDIAPDIARNLLEYDSVSRFDAYYKVCQEGNVNNCGLFSKDKGLIIPVKYWYFSLEKDRIVANVFGEPNDYYDLEGRFLRTQ